MIELESLASEVGVSKRTLVRAFTDGTLRGHRPSPRKLNFTLGEKQYVRRAWRLLGTLKEVLRTEQNVRFALLFGSVARGDDGPDSDLDLLVEMRDDSLERVLELNLKLETLLGRPVDVITVDQAESNPVLFGMAAREGRPIADRDDRWRKIRNRAATLERRADQDQSHRTRDVLSGIDQLLAR